jgi:2-iminobutanoate/2-iminopropanoate deaminase
MSKHAITSSMAPLPDGAYSAAVSSGHFVFVSAQAPRARDGGPAPGSAASQARLALDNVAHQLRATGLPLDAVVALTVYATTPEAAAAADAACAELFRPPRPARTTVGVAWLPDGAALQIAAVAARY